MQYQSLTIATLLLFSTPTIACCYAEKLHFPWESQPRVKPLNQLPTLAQVYPHDLARLPKFEEYADDYEPEKFSIQYYVSDGYCENTGFDLTPFANAQHFADSAHKDIVGQYLYCYSAWILQQRWPAAEPYIQNSAYAVAYADNVLKMPWPAAGIHKTSGYITAEVKWGPPLGPLLAPKTFANNLWQKVSTINHNLPGCLRKDTQAILLRSLDQRTFDQHSSPSAQANLRHCLSQLPPPKDSIRLPRTGWDNEKTLLTKAEKGVNGLRTAFKYAVRVRQQPWPELEQILLNKSRVAPHSVFVYLAAFPSRQSSLEPMLMQYAAEDYAMTLKGRWPAYERTSLVGDDYWQQVIRYPSPAVEATLLRRLSTLRQDTGHGTGNFNKRMYIEAVVNAQQYIDLVKHAPWPAYDAWVRQQPDTLQMLIQSLDSESALDAINTLAAEERGTGGKPAIRAYQPTHTRSPRP